MAEIEKSVQVLSEKYDEILTRLNKNDTVLKVLKKRVERIEQCEVELRLSKMR